MSVDLQIALWGLAVCSPFAVNLSIRKDVDAIGISGMLVLIWIAGRVLWVALGPPDCAALNPVIDAVAGATVFGAWLTRKALWKLALCSLYIGQIALAFDYAWHWDSRELFISYLQLNNTLFVGQILCVLFPGAVDVARSICRCMPHRPRNVHPARSGR
jgi:hypothetical protein